MNNSKNLPLAITMGCPAGIGPEIICKNFSRRLTKSPAIVIGDLSILEKVNSELKLNCQFTPWQPTDTVPNNKIGVLSLSNLIDNHTWGTPNMACGKATASYIKTAVMLTLEKVFSAIVTCPISKQVLNDAGYNFPGHTEFLAELTNTPKVMMMMAGNKLRVSMVTLHCSIASVPSQLSIDKISETISITKNSLQREFAIKKPRLAIAALNPHAGENGLFGTDETDFIIPAINRCRADDVSISAPLPPDTVFLKAIAGEYDAVVCMYHDQALIPFKLLHFEDGVNITLGMPIIRTSVDHGTAYDIAGKGIASEKSLAASMDMANIIYKNRFKV
ncbi:MAG: 4-hydroxythreonine-4-phosphate dehydrogenase PdxA [Desulfotalea sp.]